MADNFNQLASGLNSPGSEHYAITPHNSTDEAISFRAIYVGVGGDVVVVSNSGTAVTYKNAPSGSYILMRGKRVNSTNTTATNLVGVY